MKITEKFIGLKLESNHLKLIFKAYCIFINFTNDVIFFKIKMQKKK